MTSPMFVFDFWNTINVSMCLSKSSRLNKMVRNVIFNVTLLIHMTTMAAQLLPCEFVDLVWATSLTFFPAMLWYLILVYLTPRQPGL